MLKSVSYSPPGSFAGREVRSSGMWLTLLSSSLQARPGWRAELGWLPEGGEVLTERGFPRWGPLFAVIFVLESISSPLPFGPSSQPGLLGQKTGFLCRAEERNSGTPPSTGPQNNGCCFFKWQRKQILGRGESETATQQWFYPSLKQWGTRCWVS